MGAVLVSIRLDDNCV